MLPERRNNEITINNHVITHYWSPADWDHEKETQKGKKQMNGLYFILQQDVDTPNR